MVNGHAWLSILLTKTTAAQNKVALSRHRIRGLYFLAVILATTLKSSLFSGFVITIRLCLLVHKKKYYLEMLVLLGMVFVIISIRFVVLLISVKLKD